MPSAIKKSRLEILQQRFFKDLMSSEDFQTEIKKLRNKYSIDLKEQYLGNPKASDLMTCAPKEFEYLNDAKIIQLNQEFYADVKILCHHFNLPDRHIDTLRKYLLLGRLCLPPKNMVTFTRGGIQVTTDFDVSKEDWEKIWERIQDFKKQNIENSYNFGIKPKLTSKGSGSIDTILWYWRKRKNPKVKIPSTFESIINSAGNSVKNKWRVKIREWESALRSL